MRARTPLVLTCAALLPWLGLVGSPTPAEPPLLQDPGERPRRSAPLAPRDVDPRLAELTGAWQLASIQDPVLADPQVRHSGMMLIVDGYLSIELHLGLVESTAEELIESYFQSGVNRIEIDTHGQLVLDGVLGAQVDVDGFLDFEPPGRRRLYRFDLAPEELILHRLDRRARLTFTRVQHHPPQRDIFGRVIELEPEPEPEPDGEDED